MSSRLDATRTGAVDHKTVKITPHKSLWCTSQRNWWIIVLNGIREGDHTRASLMTKAGTMHLCKRGGVGGANFHRVRLSLAVIESGRIKMYPLYRNLQQNVVYPHWMGEPQWQSVVKSNATMGYSLKSNMTSLNKDKTVGFFLYRKCYSLVCYTEGYGMSGNSVLMPMSSSDGKRKWGRRGSQYS